jgi:hypothetical protein
MMHRRYQTGTIADRARRSVREIALALALTLAAFAFVVAALHSSAHEPASIATQQNTVPAEQAN